MIHDEADCLWCAPVCRQLLASQKSKFDSGKHDKGDKQHNAAAGKRTPDEPMQAKKKHKPGIAQIQGSARFEADLNLSSLRPDWLSI